MQHEDGQALPFVNHIEVEASRGHHGACSKDCHLPLSGLSSVVFAEENRENPYHTEIEHRLSDWRPAAELPEQVYRSQEPPRALPIIAAAHATGLHSHSVL